MDLSTYYKQHPEERYEHIRRMGEILSRVEQTLTKAETLLEEWKALQDDFKIVCTRKWDEEKIKNDSFANSFTKEQLKSFPFHSNYEKESIISIFMALEIREKDNIIDVYNEIIDKYTIKFGTPTNVSSNKNQKKWTWIGDKNIFVIKYKPANNSREYPILEIQLAEKEYYLR